eukprot:13182133-Alexandrium_andersonii.AAC.1
MQNRVRLSELELCGPRRGIESGTRGSRGVRSARFSVLMLKLTTTSAALGVPRGFRWGFEGAPL